jgi:uncharacterized protein YbaR (Trm112 family)
MLDPQLLDLLVCPKCKSKLEYRPEVPSLDCGTCGLRYPIRDEIPILLIDEAEPIPEA